MKVRQKVRARWNFLIRPRPYHYRPMTEPSLFHNRRARGDCSHHISFFVLTLLINLWGYHEGPNSCSLRFARLLPYYRSVCT